MRSTIAAVTAAALTLLAAPGSAAAQATGCADHASVTWDSEPQTVFVGDAEVAVPGCADGERVGLQLLTDVGDVPDEPLVATVTDERAVFDLTSLAVRIEPVTGVRVLLHGDDGPILVEIEVEQRYFNAPGREQRGLRRTDRLHVPVGSRYVVPAPGSGYAPVACDGLGVDTGDTVGEGTGVFVAERAGRHLACHQRTGGGPVDPAPDAPGPEVLGESVARGGAAAGDGGTAVLAAVERRRAAGASLPRTGYDLLVPLALGLGLIVAGSSALHSRRRGRGPGPQR